jgi:hypothetical protein
MFQKQAGSPGVGSRNCTKLRHRTISDEEVIEGQMFSLGFARRQHLTPVILTTQEAEIWRLTVQSQPEQIVHETLSQK